MSRSRDVTIGAVRRGGPGAGLVVAIGTRALLVALGFIVLLAPLPSLTGPAAVLAVLAMPLPLFTAWRPGSSWVSAVLVTAVLVWVASSLISGAPPVALTVGFGCLLYLTHATAAFAVVLPMSRRIEPAMLGRVVLRPLAILVCSVPLMVLALAAPALRGSPLLALAGVLCSLGVALVIVVLLHRRQTG